MKIIYPKGEARKSAFWQPTELKPGDVLAEEGTHTPLVVLILEDNCCQPLTTYLNGKQLRLSLTSCGTIFSKAKYRKAFITEVHLEWADEDCS